MVDAREAQTDVHDLLILRNEQPLCSCFPDSSSCRGTSSEAPPVTPLRYNAIVDTGCFGDGPTFAASSSSHDRGNREGTAHAALDDLALAHQRLFLPHRTAKLQEYYALQSSRKIGDGSYGTVHRASVRLVDAWTGKSHGRDEIAVMSNSVQVAIKSFGLQDRSSSPSGDNKTQGKGRRTDRPHKRTVASFETERTTLALLEHPHIIKMYESFVEDKALHVVLELCRGGDLFEHIVKTSQRQNRNGLSEPLARHFFEQMLFAVNYLHSKKIVHRDIKTENFLLLGEPETPQGSVIKLCDFGTAIQLSDDLPRSMEKIGTLSYTSPEVYTGLGANVCADDWSLGVVLYVLLVGASPFRMSASDSSKETMDRICKGVFDKTRRAWQEASTTARNLVQLFLVVEEANRLGCDGALRDAWILEGRPDNSENIARDEVLIGCAVTALHTLQRFQRLDKLKQVIMFICARVVSEAEFMDYALPVPWYRLFNALDTNSNGSIDYTEFVTGFNLLLGNKSDSNELAALARDLDVSCAGAISWTTWLAAALLSVDHVAQDQEPLSTVFRLIDRSSNDGVMSAADILAFMTNGAPHSSPQEMAADVSRVLSSWVAEEDTVGCWRAQGSYICPQGRPKGSPMLNLVDLRRVVNELLDHPRKGVVPREEVERATETPHRASLPQYVVAV